MTEANSTANAKANATPHRYTAALANDIETKWQQYWSDNHTFYAPNPVGDLATGACLLYTSDAADE